MNENLLSIKNLKLHFNTYRGVVKALNGVDLDIKRNEILGLVGETGCGKSVTGFSILKIVDISGKIVDGEIWFKGRNILELDEEEMRQIRGGQIAMIFQDPKAFLNPVLTIGEQIAEAIELHKPPMDLKKKKDNLPPKESSENGGEASKSKSRSWMRKLSTKSDANVEMEERIINLLEKVRISDPKTVIDQYPFELSGGMRQRILIAMAICSDPDLLISDESTTNLDVTVQAQILRLLNSLKEDVGASILLITHNMGVIAEVCDRVAVMYAGNTVEIADVFEIFSNPLHPYTKGLIRAVPKSGCKELISISGIVPELIDPPSGCRFHPRCEFVKEKCKTSPPQLVEVSPNHFVACHD
jgi:peptide/nickel transport system ATP-binding protein